MTKTLTEQWREGTLDNGYYYVSSGWSKSVETRYLGNGFFEGNIGVLAPVPSYDKVKEMSQKIERLEFDNEVLDNELKELATKNDTFAMENGRLQKRLEIATKALEEYADKDKWEHCSPDWRDAEEALKEMEGVK